MLLGAFMLVDPSALFCGGTTTGPDCELAVESAGYFKSLTTSRTPESRATTICACSAASFDGTLPVNVTTPPAVWTWIALAIGAVSLSWFNVEFAFDVIAASVIWSFTAVPLALSGEAGPCAQTLGTTANVLASADAPRIIRNLRFI
jgi:hypothetical protein